MAVHSSAALGLQFSREKRIKTAVPNVIIELCSMTV